MNGTADNLLRALTALVEGDPERGGLVVRRAIASLVSDDSRKLGRPSGKDAAGWAHTRDRLRARMEERGINCEDLARVLGLSVSATQKASAPNGAPPSTAIAAKVEGWLNANADPTPDSPPPQAGNGHSLPDRLSEAERQQLSGYVALDPVATRRTSRLTRDEITAAVAGEALPADVIDRARGFLRR